MRKLNPALILACALPFTMLACGSKSNTDPVKNIQEAAKDPDLQGKIFRGECSLKPLDTIATGIATAGDASIKSAREQYEFVGANITHATLLYNTPDCTGTESIIFKETGTVDIHNDKKSQDEGKYIDWTMSHLMVQVTNDPGLKIAQGIKLCGAIDLSDGKEHEVTANSKDLICYRKQVPSHDLNLYKLEGNTLYFGQKEIFERNDTRPANLDKNTKYQAN